MKGGIGALLILASVVLAVLKVAGVIAWPWLAVLLPAIVLGGLFVLTLVFALVAFLLTLAVDHR